MELYDTWGRTMTEVTVEITQFCEESCDYCSTNASPQGQHLEFETIEKFLKAVDNITRINISGGEPLSHPDFYKIIKLCESYCDEVWTYTNALKRIIYNADVLKEIEIHANVCLVAGRNHYIPKNVDKTHVLKLIHQGRAKKLPEQNVVVSRNFWDIDACDSCQHLLLQADGNIVKAPCKKTYR